MVNLCLIQIFRLFLIFAGWKFSTLSGQLSAFDLTNFTTAVLSNAITDDYPNIPITNLTDIALHSIDSFTKSASNYTLPDNLLSNNDSSNLDASEIINESSPKNFENPLFSMQILPSNSTAWEILKAQI